MPQDSINKIKEAEKNAKEMIEKAKQEVEESIFTEKNSTENDLQNISDQADEMTANSVKRAGEESERIKTERKKEIEDKMNSVKNSAENKIDEAVNFVVEEFVSRYK